jgi:hypothetical protein
VNYCNIFVIKKNTLIRNKRIPHTRMPSCRHLKFNPAGCKCVHNFTDFVESCSASSTPEPLRPLLLLPLLPLRSPPFRQVLCDSSINGTVN